MLHSLFCRHFTRLKCKLKELLKKVFLNSNLINNKMYSHDYSLFSLLIMLSAAKTPKIEKLLTGIPAK